MPDTIITEHNGDWLTHATTDCPVVRDGRYHQSKLKPSNAIPCTQCYLPEGYERRVFATLDVIAAITLVDVSPRGWQARTELFSWLLNEPGREGEIGDARDIMAEAHPELKSHTKLITDIFELYGDDVTGYLYYALGLAAAEAVATVGPYMVLCRKTQAQPVDNAANL